MYIFHTRDSGKPENMGRPTYGEWSWKGGSLNTKHGRNSGSHRTILLGVASEATRRAQAWSCDVMNVLSMTLSDFCIKIPVTHNRRGWRVVTVVYEWGRWSWPFCDSVEDMRWMMKVEFKYWGMDGKWGGNGSQGSLHVYVLSTVYVIFVRESNGLSPI